MDIHSIACYLACQAIKSNYPEKEDYLRALDFYLARLDKWQLSSFVYHLAQVEDAYAKYRT
jgi:hypothetical protein